MIAKQELPNPLELLKQGQYQQALEAIALWAKRDVSSLEDPLGHHVPLEQAIQQVIQAYVRYLREHIPQQIAELQSKVETHPEEVQQKVEELRARIQTGLLPPWHRPKDLLQDLQALQEQAQFWLQRRKQAQEMVEKAKTPKTDSPALRWAYLHQASQLYPYRIQDIDIQAELHKAEQEWKERLEQLLQKAKQLETPHDERTFRKLFSQLRKVLQEQSPEAIVPFEQWPDAIRTLWRQLQEQDQRLRNRYHEFQHFESLLPKIETLLEGLPTATKLQQARQLLESIPDAFRNHPRTQTLRSILEDRQKELDRAHQIFQMLEACIHNLRQAFLFPQSAASPITEEIPSCAILAIHEALSDLSLLKPLVTPLVRATEEAYYGHQAHAEGLFAYALGHYLEAFQALSSQQPYHDFFPSPLYTILQQLLRQRIDHLLSHTEEEKWKALLDFWQQSVHALLEDFQDKPFQLTHFQRLLHAWEVLRKIRNHPHLPPEFRPAFQTLFQQLDQTLSTLHGESIPKQLTQLHQILLQLQEHLQTSQQDFDFQAHHLLQQALEYVSQLRAFFPFPHLSQELLEHFIKQQSVWNQTLEQAIQAFSQWLHVLRDYLPQLRKPLDRIAPLILSPLQEFFNKITSLSLILQQVEKATNTPDSAQPPSLSPLQMDTAFATQTRHLLAIAEILHSPESFLKALRSPHEYRELLRRLEQISAKNPFANSLLQILRSSSSRFPNFLWRPWKSP